jgi:hypothetical protein
MNVCNRIAKYRNPGWELAAPNEFVVNGELGCTFAMSCQGLTAAVKAFATGRQIGQTILDDVNYDAVTAGLLRVAKTSERRLETSVAVSQA